MNFTTVITTVITDMKSTSGMKITNMKITSEITSEIITKIITKVMVKIKVITIYQIIT